MKKILFRADAAPHIGIGDLMSLINISDYFDENCEKHFMIKNYKAGVDLIARYNVKNCMVIDAEISIENEVDLINSYIVDNDIDIIFFEITERKLSDYKNIVSTVKKVAVNFDGYILEDLALVIDWDVEAYKFFEPQKHPKTKFLLGPEYVILPKEFYFQKILRKKKNDFASKKVLIAMGGADEFDFTGKVVESIIGSKLDVTLNIIIGSGYEYTEALKEKLNKSEIKYSIKQNITNMLDEYLNCDIGIGAGGLTSSELVAAKASAILIATYEHQIARCKYFQVKGWARYLGYREFNDIELIDAILNPIDPCENDLFNTYKIVESIDEL